MMFGLKNKTGFVGVIINIILALSFILTFAYFILVGYLGVKAHEEYKENNSSIGLMIGGFIKDIKTGMGN
jgi:hypothetical protein